MSTVITAAVVTRRLDGLDLERLGVPPQPRRRHCAPPLRVGPAPASTALPAPAHVLELAILERTPRCRGERGGEANVGAGRVMARVEIEVRRGAVVPGYGGVRAGVRLGVAMAHFEGCRGLRGCEWGEGGVGTDRTEVCGTRRALWA